MNTHCKRNPRPFFSGVPQKPAFWGFAAGLASKSYKEVLLPLGSKNPRRSAVGFFKKVLCLRRPIGQGFWIVVLTVIAIRTAAVQAQELSGEEIMRRSNIARYYPGKDMQARMAMRLVAGEGRERIREFTLSRYNLQEGGEQRYFIYFHRPPDVRDTALLVWKYPNRDDDRWLYIPAVKQVRRIAASDKHTSFVGSDFTYEDVSGRDTAEDTHKLLREEKVEGQETFVIESVPREMGGADFSRKVSWIDKVTLLPLKEEYFDSRGDLARVFTAGDVKKVEGFWTMMKRVMKNTQSGHWTEVTFSKVRYNLKLSTEVFSERSLRAPSAELTK